MAFSDSFILERAAQEEIEHPLPRKTTKDRTIYLARNYFGFRMDSLGVPVITDFGLSVYGDKGPHNHEIQPDGYRAPEVIIGANWSYSADIWNLGALVRPNELLPLDILTMHLDLGTADWGVAF